MCKVTLYKPPINNFKMTQTTCTRLSVIYTKILSSMTYYLLATIYEIVSLDLTLQNCLSKMY